MLGKVSFSVFDVLHDTLQIAKIAFRVEGVCRNFKGDAILSANFLGKDSKGGAHRETHLRAGSLHSLLYICVHLKIDVDCVCHIKHPFLIQVYAKYKEKVKRFSLSIRKSLSQKQEKDFDVSGLKAQAAFVAGRRDLRRRRRSQRMTMPAAPVTVARQRAAEAPPRSSRRPPRTLLRTMPMVLAMVK